MSQPAPILTPAAPAPTPPPGLTARLSVMMFLQYAIQGAWLPVLFAFLQDYRGFRDAELAWLGAAGAIGAVVSPFLAGQIADRYLNAERFMFVAHLAGAVIVWRLSEATAFGQVLLLAFLYGALYTPTLAVGNAIAFAHLPDRDRDFGKVRVWGTIGWIVVGIAIGQWLYRVHTPAAGSAADVTYTQARGMVDAFRLSAVLGVLQAVYCLTLPKTPPKRERKNYAPGEAIAEIRRRRALVTIFLLSIPVAAVHSFFFARTAQYLLHLRLEAPAIDRIFGVGGGPMTIGQISEVVVLALMPLVATRVPRKALLAVGLLAYTARFFVFAYLPYPWAIYPGLALHGLVFGCFFFICFMVIDELTSADVRSSAQNLFNLIVFGVGVIVGNLLAGWIADWTRLADGGMNWQAFYAIPGWVTVACLAALLVFYPRRSAVVRREGLAAA